MVNELYLKHHAIKRMKLVVGNLRKAILDAFKTFLGIKSPSRLLDYPINNTIISKDGKELKKGGTKLW